MTPVERYLRLAREREVALVVNRGVLPDDVEDKFLDELDVLWWQMTLAEQEAVKTALHAEDVAECQP